MLKLFLKIRFNFVSSTKIYWKDALEILKTGTKIPQDAIDFQNELIHWKTVQE